MQIVIDIPQNLYQEIMDNADEIQENGCVFDRAIANGTPLPRHGDLIDVNRQITVLIYDEQYEEWGEETLTVLEALNRWSNEGVTVKDVVILADNVESEG